MWMCVCILGTLEIAFGQFSDSFSEYLQDEFGLTEQEATDFTSDEAVETSFNDTLELLGGNDNTRDAIESTTGKTIQEIMANPTLEDIESILENGNVLRTIGDEFGDSDTLRNLFEAFGQVLLHSFADDYSELQDVVRVLSYRVGAGTTAAAALAANSDRIYTWDYDKKFTEEAYHLYLSSGVSASAGYINATVVDFNRVQNLVIETDNLSKTEEDLQKGFPEIGIMPTWINFGLRYYPKTIPRRVSNPLHWDMGIKFFASPRTSFQYSLAHNLRMSLTSDNIGGGLDFRISFNRNPSLDLRLLLGSSFLIGQNKLTIELDGEVPEGPLTLNTTINNTLTHWTFNSGLEFEFNWAFIKFVLAPQLIFNVLGRSVVETESIAADLIYGGAFPIRLPLTRDNLTIYGGFVDFQLGILIELLRHINLYTSIFFPLGDLQSSRPDIDLSNDDFRFGVSTYVGLHFKL